MAQVSAGTRAMAAAAAVAAAALIAGCGGSSSTSAPSAGASSQSTSPGGGAPGTVVTATETEFKITLSRASFTPGTYTFMAKDSGHVPHSLAVVGPGVSGKTQVLQPGQDGRLTVTLQAGTYEVYCAVDGHKGLGMDMKIHVTG